MFIVESMKDRKTQESQSEIFMNNFVSVVLVLSFLFTYTELSKIKFLI